MISIGENKSILCKGDFHPAQLYKGDKKIAGYESAEFIGNGGVTLEACYNDNLHNVVIHGNSVQDGTPTPENSIEVQSVGEKVTEGEYAGKYKVPVTVRGKNLLDLSRLAYHSISEAGLTAEPYGKDGIRVYGTPEEVRTINLGVGNVGYGYDFPYKTGTVFRMSVSLHPAYNNITGNSSIGYFSRGKSDDGWSTYITCSKKELTHDIDKIEVATVVITPKDTEAYLDFVILPQLELGDTATPYEPYIEPQTLDIYLDEPLRKIGRFADYIDFEKSVVARNVGKYVYTGNENWLEHASKNLLHCSTGVKTFTVTNNLAAQSNRITGVTWFDLSQNVSRADSSLMVGVACAYNLSSNLRYIYVCPYKTTIKVAEWKAQLQQWNAEGNPFTVWYAIPTAECAIELPKIPTFKGTTIYEINTSISTDISGNYKKQEVK